MKKVITFCLLVIFQFSILIEAQTIITIGQVYNFSQSQSSTVNYLFSLDRPGEITLYINNWLSTYDWGTDFDRIYIYNDEGVVIGRNGFSTVEDPFLFHMFAANQGMKFSLGKAGNYTIAVHSGVKRSDWGTATTQNYEMSLSAIYCNDPYELNDDMPNATLINIGETITAYEWRQINTNEIWGDEDWYKINIPYPGILKLDLQDWVGIYNWGTDFDRLHVYNAVGTEIGFRDGNAFYSWMMGSPNDTVPYTTSMNLSQAGTYYLRFHSGVGTSTKPYKLTTFFTPANDIYEPNDNFATAKFINNNDWHEAFEWRSLDSTMNVAGDEDYFYFLAAGSGTYNITLNGWIPIYNWGANYDWMTIYNENFNPVGANPLSWMMGANPINFNIPSAGKYYIQLHCGGTYSIEGYRFILNGSLVGVDDANTKPNNFSLEQNYPNPFNPSTKISYSIPFVSKVKINIYNLLGEHVSELINQIQNEGNYEISFSANSLPVELTSGIYFYTISASSIDGKHNYNNSKKMLLLK